MILLCDENIGTGVPRALYNVDRDARSIIDLGWRTYKDVEWLSLASKSNWLILSRHMRMILVQEERDVIIKQKLGMVYLTNGNDHPYQVLRLLLTKWDALELIDKLPRPFARFLSPNGRVAPQFSKYTL